ncbi:MAG: GlcNAc-PI de-N-acetylase [Chloroflexi bacterium]|nr:MAG: GlcNAc-PI de-N-acetylase [Chloroflexota bacterium]
MLATFGMEMVECGGTLAKHAAGGATVTVAVAMPRPEAAGQLRAAAGHLGVHDLRLLNWGYGDLHVDRASKRVIMQLVREVRPEIVICQDPEHSALDLDPDRREFMLLYVEALALAGRDIDVAECGPPHNVSAVYFMTPDRPNCVVEVVDVYARKEAAMRELGFQLAFSGQSFRRQHPPERLRLVLDDPQADRLSDADLGWALHRQTDRAAALYHGLYGHSGAVMAEPYRRMTLFPFDTLPG